MIDPTDCCVLLEPLIQPLLTSVRKGHATATAHPTQREATDWRQEDSESQAQGRSFRVAAKVIDDAFSKRLSAAFILGRNPEVEQRHPIPPMAIRRRNVRRRITKEPSVNAPSGGHEGGIREDGAPAEQRRVKVKCHCGCWHGRQWQRIFMKHQR